MECARTGASIRPIRAGLSSAKLTIAAPVLGRKAPGSGAGPRILLPDQEDGLVRAGQAELLPGQPLDRSGALPQRADLAHQLGVLGTQGLDLDSQDLDLLPLLHQIQEATVSEDRADGQGDESDDGSQDEGLSAKARLPLYTVISLRQNLILCFNY